MHNLVHDDEAQSADPAAPSALDATAAPIAEPITDHDRYSRQVLFHGIGAEGQRRLQQAHAAIVGIGATGAATAGLLARAGVGCLTLIDRDFVEPSNLQRQVLFDEDDARDSLPKAEAARRHLARIDSSVTVAAHIADLVPANIATLLAGADIILDGTDNFETRYLLNDFCVQQSIPWIYAAAVGSYAATMNILPKSSLAVVEVRHSERSEEPHLRTERSDVPASPLSSACLSCLFPTPPSGNIETCDTAGILSTAVNLAASLQTTEALKFLTGQPHLMRRTLLSFDLWTGEHSEISTAVPRPDCQICSLRQFNYLAGIGRPHITLCGRNSVQIHEHHRPIDLLALQTRLAPLSHIQNVRANTMLLRFDVPPHTLTVFPDGRALIQGTTDIALARSLYARFIGA